MLEYARSYWKGVITRRAHHTGHLTVIIAGLLIAHANTFAAAGSEWRALAKEELPTSITADLAVGNKTTIAAFNSKQGSITVYTTGSEPVRQRSVVTATSAGEDVTLTTKSTSDQGLTVTLSSNSGGALLDVSFLPGGNIMAFKPGKTKTLHIHDTDIRYGIVPSLIGVDLVYDPARYEQEKELHIPSMNMFVGLADGNDAMMVGVWGKGNQAVKLGLDNSDGERLISDFSIDMDEQKFYLAYIEHQNIWHAEKLKDTYLETDTEIDWQRPFDARWIGRIYLKGMGASYPFHAQTERRKISGRYVGGWFIWPFWFDGDKTMLHFEKQFPPMGEALIYYLDDDGKGDESSPIGIMEQALGSDRATAILDRKGVPPAQLLAHGHAVCAMLYITLGVRVPYYDDTFVVDSTLSYYDDIVTFIDLIRQRIYVFLAYAEEMKTFLNEQEQAHPGFTESVKPLHEILLQMEGHGNQIPGESLDQVREWTKQLKKIRETTPLDSKTFKHFDQNCRRVAGRQDGLAMRLSWDATRIMEQSAEFAVKSPEHCKLAEQIIAKTRKVLRNGTWWEPTRIYWPPRVAAPCMPEKEGGTVSR